MRKEYSLFSSNSTAATVQELMLRPRGATKKTASERKPPALTRSLHAAVVVAAEGSATRLAVHVRVSDELGGGAFVGEGGARR